MRFTPTRPITLKTPQGPRVYQPGETFEASEDKARPYLEQGMLRSFEPRTDSVEDFKSHNLAIRIRSKVLGEDIWLVSNEATREHLQAEGLPVYLADEISHLKGLSPEELRKINTVKKQFEKSRVIEKLLTLEMEQDRGTL